MRNQELSTWAAPDSNKDAPDGLERSEFIGYESIRFFIRYGKCVWKVYVQNWDYCGGESDVFVILHPDCYNWGFFYSAVPRYA